MASNLAGGLCIGQFNACLVRAARLDSDCSPSGGADSGIITAGLVTMTASPEIEEGTVFEPKNGCGSISWTYEEADKIKRYNLSGEFIFFDWEMMELLFGGNTITGHASRSDFPGKVIGHAMPNYSNPPENGVYLEVITQAAGQDVGSCASAANPFPAYVGHIFGKVKLVPGDRAFENAEARLAFSGKATQNPNLFDGPWNDYPGTGYIPNSPYVTVGYSQAEYDAMVALAACGYATLPAAS